ncbi:MAG TPA: family 78 glycoside hydrolase catalytic domain [Chthoniobacteraceae bacterium]|jgi:hypothetical protein
MIRLLLLSLFCASTALSLTVDTLRVEARDNPLGIDVPQPRLSWLPQSATRGDLQSSYQVIVASSAALLAQDRGDLWESGAVKSSETTHISYAGQPLRSAQQIFWKVRVWDKLGQPSPWSSPATWTMGLLDAADWKARWIGLAAAESAERKQRGYHAGETARQDELKWVQVDLGQSFPISTIRLHPMQHDDKDGFGFPLRFKVEVSDDTGFASAETIADHTSADYPNPGRKPVTFDATKAAAGKPRRFVRITASKLWQRNPTAFPFALSQLEVVSGGKNAAVGKLVTAKDSVEAFGWGSASLTDGLGLIDPTAPSAAATLLLRKEFEVKPGLLRATAFVCGLGYYEMTLNGGKVTDDVLTPGWTKYNKTCLYDTHDVTRTLRAGRNAVGLFLGNGMYHVKAGGRYAKFQGSFGPQKAIAQILCEYQDGTREWIVTDEQWRVGAGPITFTSVYGGEDYDARLEQRGWDQPGFDASKWTAARILTGPGGALKGLSCAAPPIRKFDLLKPAKTTVLKPGVTLFDLGQNASQMPKITVRGPAGASIKLSPAELLKPDGSVDQKSIGQPTYCVYTLSGTGSQTWSPRFFYCGYRYLQVECLAPTGGGALPVIENLESTVVHTSSRTAGEFTTSSDLFNRIHALIRWAQRSNMVSSLTDCPHREKLGWLEQIHLNGPALRYNFDLDAFFTKTMNDMADSQTPEGLIPSIAPEFPVFKDGFRDSPEWGSALLLVAWQQHQFTGDASLLRRYYEPMVRYVDYLGKKAKDDIVSHGLSDWYDIGPGAPGMSKLTPLGVTGTAFYFEDHRVLAEAARMLGRTEDATRYEEKAARIRAAFNSKFFNVATAQYSSGSQCANSIPLVMDLVAPEHRPAVLGNILQNLDSKGLTAGDVGYRYLLRALAESGRSDVIFAMNHQSEKPGYGFQLKQGATSLAEAWDAHAGSSQNHFMLGQINEWFFHDLAGIQSDPAAPGFRKIVIKPAPVGDLKFVKASYQSVRGKISSEWERDGARFKLRTTIPPNTSARIFLPTSDANSVTESGKPIGNQTGVVFLKMENGAAVYEVSGGTYEFTSNL